MGLQGYAPRSGSNVDPAHALHISDAERFLGAQISGVSRLDVSDLLLRPTPRSGGMSDSRPPSQDCTGAAITATPLLETHVLSGSMLSVAVGVDNQVSCDVCDYSARAIASWIDALARVT